MSIELERRLRDRFHERAAGVACRDDLDAVLHGTTLVALAPHAGLDHRRLVPTLVLAGVAASVVIGAVASIQTRGLDGVGSDVAMTPDAPTGRTLPTEILTRFAGDAPLRRVLTVRGVDLYLATPDANTTCLVVDSGAGYTGGCNPNTDIASDGVWQQSQDHPPAAIVLAGVTPPDVTGVIVNGHAVALVEHAWLVVLDSPTDRYTLVHDDGARRDVILDPNLANARTAPGSIPEPTTTITVTEPSTTAPATGAGMLPGESVNEAYQRLMRACMSAFGDHGTDGDAVADGVTFTATAYDLDNPVTKQHYEICDPRARAQLPLPAATR